MTPPEAERREVIAAAEAAGFTVKTGPKETRAAPVTAEDLESLSCEKNAIAGAQDGRTSSIDPEVIPPDDRPEPDDPTTIGNDGKIIDPEIIEAGIRLSQQLEIALDRGYSLPSVIDTLIKIADPMAAEETRAFAEKIYAEAAEIAKQERLQATKVSEDAIQDLQNIPEEMIDQLDKAFEDETAEGERKGALDKKCLKFHPTDAGNGERFATRFGERVKYCHPRRLWYQWDGTRWVEDPGRAVYGRAKETARAIYHEGLLVQDDGKRQALMKWAIQSEGKKQLDSMLFMASSEEMISIQPDGLDADGNLFNLRNGTLELDTLTFREHRKEDRITKIAGVSYDPAAPHPLWDAHLRLIFDEKLELIEAFQEHIGYCLLSGNPHHIFEIWYGKTGFNGKTATIKTISRVFGGYACSTNASTFMLSKKDGNAPKPELLALRGARLVTAVESEEGADLAEGTVKSMTGGDEITTRGLFKDVESFFPEYTAILATNHSPRIKGTDDAIWNRIRRWPFTVRIPDEKIIPDFDTRLSEEGPGILNWMIAGLRRYYAAGYKFNDPPELLESTRKYREDQDVILKFVDSKCVLNPIQYVAKSLLYLEFEKWCEETGEFAVSKKEFFKAFMDRKYRFYSPGNIRSIQGIRLKTSKEEEEWEFNTQNGS